PPAVVYAQVNDFRNWAQFNPWQELDTNAKVTFEGPTSGEGAKFNWEGNSNMGSGNMTITASKPDERVDIAMHFIEPMEGEANTAFTMQPEGTGTKVTWSMDGKNGYLSKIICLFMDMDKMIGGQYEKGLAKLAELPATMDAPSVPIEITRVFDAPRERVWNAWTKPEEYMRWWGPKNYTCPVAKLDPREGGTYLTAMRSPEGRTYWSTGTYREVAPMERIVCTDSFADSTGKVVPAAQVGLPGNWPDMAKATLTFADEGGKTRMTLTYEGVPAQMTQLCTTGWNESFDKLDALVAKK
ncbi:MAG TPA: SRPBCC domain-containing protein, partial [Flavobacteriales bacterium]|nr:SRPBCC domain-containing protein [Flavobacteriales bacterium]